MGHSERKILFVGNKLIKKYHFFDSIVGHSSQMRAHSWVSRGAHRKHYKRYFDPFTIQKCPIFIQFQPKIAVPIWSLHYTRILRILVEDEENKSIRRDGEGSSNEGGTKFRLNEMGGSKL